MAHADRLSALDASFLHLETDAAPMHVGAVAVFSGVPRGAGMLSERLARYVEAAVERVPRYRQKLAWAFRQPFWIDDAGFDVGRHVRTATLPQLGAERALEDLMGGLFAGPLDRGRPLWEMHVAEGLAGGGAAMLMKTHHCMIDGVAGVGLMGQLMRATPDGTEPDPRPFVARPAPRRGELVRAELRHRAAALAALSRHARSAAREPGAALAAARDSLGGLAGSLRTGLAPASACSLNARSIGPRRRVGWLRLDLAEVKAIKTRLGGTVNDVVVAVVAGALRRFLARRGDRPATLEDFRAVLPVSLRGAAPAAATGNQVGMLLARLPLTEEDPRRRYDAVREVTEYLKTRSRQAAGIALLERLSDHTTGALLTGMIRLALHRRAYNVVVTNVAGPPFPLYLLGARMEAIYPLVPLYHNQALGIALLSYAGGLYWGFSADHDQVPDLQELIADVRSAFDELSGLAGLALAPRDGTALAFPGPGCDPRAQLTQPAPLRR
jgi:WS/DGAT/MGAT family acyltransferase